MPRFPNDRNQIINISSSEQNQTNLNSMNIDSDNNEENENQHIPQKDSNSLDLNVENIENEIIEDHSKNVYYPDKFKLCFIPQDEISKKVADITLKILLINIKLKSDIKGRCYKSNEVYVVNKKWYEKWKKYARYGTMKRIIKAYDFYQSKPILYKQENKNCPHPGIINNEELLIRYKINNNDGRNILVSKNSNAFDTKLNHLKKNKAEDFVFMIPEKFKLLNDYFKCDHVLKAEIFVDRDNKSYDAFYAHLNLVFLPTLSSFKEVNDNFEEFKKKHNIIYDVYFKQTANSNDIMKELKYILKENREILVNMGIKFISEDSEDELMNHLNFIKLYYTRDNNDKTLQEMLDFIFKKETIENLKQNKKISLNDIKIKKMNLYNSRLDTMFSYNWMTAKTNIDEIKNGYIFVEYLPKDDINEEKIISIFETEKTEEYNYISEQRARRIDDDDVEMMNSEHSINNIHNGNYKKDYNLDDQPLDEKNNKNGLVGLNNLGNTCYMNTGLQCLSNCELLTKYFLQKIYKKYINLENPIGTKGEIVEKFSQLIHHLWYGNRDYISPIQFKKAFGKVYQAFNDYRQQDTQEFISYLLDSLHEDLNKVIKKPYIKIKDLNNELTDEQIFNIKKELYLCRNQSFIADLFCGFYKSTVFCPDENCKNISKSFEPFNMITLPLINEAEIRKIDEFMEEEYKKMGISEINVFFIPFKINYKPFYFQVKIKKNMEIENFKKKIEIITGFNSNTFEIYKVQNNEYVGVKNDIKILDDFLKGEKRIFLMQIPPYVFGKKLNFFDKKYEKLNANMDTFFLEEEKYEGNNIYEIYDDNKKKDENINIIINNNEEKMDIENNKLLEQKKKNGENDNEINEDKLNNIEINKQINQNNSAREQQNNNSILNKDSIDDESTAVNYNINNEANTEMCDDDDNDDEITYVIDKTLWIKAELYNYTYKINRENNNEVAEEKIANPRIIYINKNWSNAQMYDCILMMLEGARNDLPEIKEMWYKDLEEITTNLNALDKNVSYEQFDQINTHPLMIQYLKYYNYNKEEITKKTENCENCIFIYSPEEFKIKNILEEAQKNGNNLEDSEILFKILWKPNFSNDYKEGIEPIIIEKSEKLEEIFKNLRQEKYFEKKGLKKNRDGNDTVKKTVNLEEILQNFNQIEKLSKDNEWYCPKCKNHQLADKKMEIYSISEIVILHLKRFRNSSHKIETLVNFPIENLDLTKFLPSKKDTKYIYDLFAVANHIGGLHGGHYFAYCKNCKDNEWYEFNDSNVDKIDKNRIVTENAYLLFYKRRRDENNKINEDELFNKPFIEIDHTKYE